jgi:copper(I)-binding protein
MPVLATQLKVFAFLLVCGLAGFTYGRYRPVAGPPLAQEASARVLPNGVGAAYLRLLNRSAAPDQLLSVSSPWARSAELHEVVAEGELLRMVPHPEGFPVPARGSLELSVGGKHVMLYGVALPRGATELPLTLHLRRAGRLELRVPLHPLAAEEGP